MAELGFEVVKYEPLHVKGLGWTVVKWVKGQSSPIRFPIVHKKKLTEEEAHKQTIKLQQELERENDYATNE